MFLKVNAVATGINKKFLKVNAVAVMYEFLTP